MTGLIWVSFFFHRGEISSAFQFLLYTLVGINCKCFCVFSSTNKTDCHDITEILLKVALNTITLTLTLNSRVDEVPLERLHIGHYNILTLQFLKTSLSGFDFYQLQLVAIQRESTLERCILVLSLLMICMILCSKSGTY